MARIFRPTLLDVFGITNLELGTCFSMYGVVAMVSYFFGGPLADRYSLRRLMALALLLTSCGGFMMAAFPVRSTLFFLYPYWGFTTIFLFWAALIKATREWGGDGFQGRAYGWLEGGRGAVAASIGMFTWFLFSFSGIEAHDGKMEASFRLVIATASLLTLLASYLVFRFIPDAIVSDDHDTKMPGFGDIRKIMSMRVVWLQAFIIICAYVGYKVTDDISLYADQVLGKNQVISAAIGTFILWLRPVFAIIAGVMADRMQPVRIISICFLLIVIGGIIVWSGAVSHLYGVTLLTFAFTVSGVYGLRGIYFAVMKGSGVPLKATGTAVGIMSVVGYTPDVFMSPLMGYLLDNNPGEQGHQYVFLVLSIFAAIGFMVSMILGNVMNEKS